MFTPFSRSLHYTGNAVIASVNTPSAAFAMQHQNAKPCHDLMGGTEAMRRAGAAYILREQREDAAEWRTRVDRTVLRNVFSQTIGYNRGQVFSRPVVLDDADGTLGDEVMERFRAWAENVNRQGRNLTSWSGDVFAQGLADGVTFALADYPSIEMREEDGVTFYKTDSGEWRRKTAASAGEEGWTPYLVHVPADRVLDCRAEWRKGRHVITHFRYFYSLTEPDPANRWAETQVDYVRAYWPDRWEIWRKPEGAPTFVMWRQGRLSLPEIPLAVFMPGERRTDFTARPALMDLAWLNIRHWQATSEQYVLMSFARRPPWYIVGVDQNANLGPDGQPEPLTFHAGKVFFLPQGGAIASAGVDAGSIAAGRQELKDLEEAMASYGLQLLQAPTGRATATQVERETRENNSALRNWALDFQDFLENCLRFVGMWWGLEDGPSAKVNDDFAATADADYLLQLHDKGLISKETLSLMLKRVGVLPDDYDFADESARLARDAATAANAGPNFQASLQTSLMERLTGADNHK